MSRHLHLVPAGADLADAEELDEVVDAYTRQGNVVDLEFERARRRHRRYHPSAANAWLDDLFDEDPLDPVC